MIVVVAVGLRVYPWCKPHVLSGMMEYDGGVYYASARALLAGQVPYRDVTILHPPAVPLLLAPFAAVSSWLSDPIGLALARFAIVGASVANLWMLRTLSLRYVGGVTALVALALYPVYPNAASCGHRIRVRRSQLDG